MRLPVFVLCLFTVVAQPLVSNAQVVVFDGSRIKNPIVQTMNADSQYYYLFVKDTCGATAPLNSRILKLQWETYKDAVLAVLEFNIRYFQGRIHSLSNDALTVEVQRIISSPGAQVALQECYGSNNASKALYTELLIQNDQAATKNGLITSIVGGGFVLGLVARVGWAPIAYSMRLLNKSQESIAAAKKLVGAGVAVGLTGTAAYTIHQEVKKVHNENTLDNEFFACANQIEIPEKMVDDDVKALVNSRSTFWQEALRTDLDRLFAVYDGCNEQELNSNQIQILKEKTQKYKKIKEEDL